MFWRKIFLFYRPTDRKIFLLLPVEQLINLEWPYHCKQWSRSNLPQIFNENKQLNDLLEQLIKPPLWVIPNIESNTSLSIFSFQHGVNHTQTHTHQHPSVLLRANLPYSGIFKSSRSSQKFSWVWKARIFKSNKSLLSVSHPSLLKLLHPLNAGMLKMLELYYHYGYFL